MKKVILAVMLSLALAFSATSVMADPGPYNTLRCADTNGGTFSPCETSNTYDVYNAINRVFADHGVMNPVLTDNEGADTYQFTGANEFWSQLSPDDASQFAFISITATNRNTLGVYPAGGDATTDSTFSSLSFTSSGKFTGSGTAVDPYPGIINPLGAANFGFSLKSQKPDGTLDNIWASEVAQNSDGFDHMLAYLLSDLSGEVIYIRLDSNSDGVLDALDDPATPITLSDDTFLLAWEDKPIGAFGGDSDYNDAIFLVTRIQPTTVPVPEPMSMLLLGSGLAAMGATRRKKRS